MMKMQSSLQELNSKLRRVNRRFFLAARQKVQAPSALAPQRQFKIQNCEC